MRTFEENVERKLAELKKVIIRKQKDYGKNNILNTVISEENGGPRLGVLQRLNDKIARGSNLLQSRREPENEAMKDTWLDIAGYGVIGMMLEDSTFDSPMADELRKDED